MSPTGLWASLIGSTVWLPLVLAAWILSGGDTAWAFALLSVPYVSVVYWLLVQRRRSAAVVWQGWFLTGLGGYSCYLWALTEWWLVHGETIPPAGVADEHAPWLAAGGAACVAVGLRLLYRHARKVRTLPRLERAVLTG